MFKPQMSMLAFEAQQVVWLRGIELARGGPAAKREAARMVNENAAASRQAVLKAASGTAPKALFVGISARSGQMLVACLDRRL